jgi:hypothetical protein
VRIDGTAKKSLSEILQELGDAQEKIEVKYDQDVSQFWNGLTTEQQMMAFYHVIKQVTEAELKEDFESYRTILYTRFGFPSESYMIGMMCGFMELHNSIIPRSDQTAYREFMRGKTQNAKNRTDN